MALPQARADDFIVDSATFVTNGGIAPPLLGGDTLTVTGTGSIATVTDSTFGVFAEDDNAIFSSGTVSTGGDQSVGILFDDDNWVANEGVITTTGAQADGMAGDSDNLIDNSGSILTTGVNAIGIYGYSDNAIFNSGAIATTGSEAYGILIEAGGNAIDSSGSIATSGSQAHAIYSTGSEAVIVHSGTISTSGNGAYGIRNEGMDGWIENRGTIATSGVNARGIRVAGSGLVMNSGTISTGGNSASGIETDGSLNWVVNSGAIVTDGSLSHGILSNGDATILQNSGTITILFDNAYGIFANRFSIVENSGTIRTEGDFGYAIRLDDDNTIWNSGSIITEGASAAGIRAADFNLIRHSGRIRTSGADAEGMRLSDFNTVYNSGLVVSAQSDAFWFSGAGNALWLSAPAFIGGAITMSQPVAVDIGTGPSHSVFWTFDGGFAGGAPALSGPVPWFYDAASQTFATYDPTALMASGDQLAALSGAVAELARNRLDAAHARDGGARDGGAGDGGLASAAAFGAGRLAGDGAGIWIAGLSGTGGRDGTDTALAHELGHLGVAAGADAVFGALTLGAMAGYAETRLKAESPFAAAHDVAARGGFAGLYGRYRPGRLVLDASLAGGWTGHDQDRFVNDNLAPLGVSTASASYSGWWLSPGLAVALPLEAGRWTFTPALSGRYAVQWLDAYRETGAYSAAANASLAARRVAVGEARGEIALARAFTIADAAGQVALSAGALARADLGDDDAAVTLNGSTLALPATADNLAATFLGASASFTFGKTRLSLAAETAFGNHGYQHTTGSLELGLRF
jgi:hypothetical protein